MVGVCVHACAQIYRVSPAILSITSIASFGIRFLSNLKTPCSKPLFSSEGLENIILTILFFLSGSTLKSSSGVMKFMIDALSPVFELSVFARRPPSHDTPVISLLRKPFFAFSVLPSKLLRQRCQFVLGDDTQKVPSPLTT